MKKTVLFWNIVFLLSVGVTFSASAEPSVKELYSEVLNAPQLTFDVMDWDGEVQSITILPDRYDKGTLDINQDG